MGLSLHDDLVLLVDCGYSGVALHHAFGRGHLGRLVVGAIGQSHFALGALALLRVLLQPLADLFCLAIEPLDLALLALR